MTLLTEATDVFAAAEPSGRCLVAFIAKRFETDVCSAYLLEPDRAHLVLVDNPEHNPKGDFFLSGDRVISSALSPQRPALTFSGIGLYKPALFTHIVRGSKAPLAPLLREQIALGRVGGEHHRGMWVDVGTPQRLDELDKQLRASQNDRHD